MADYEKLCNEVVDLVRVTGEYIRNELNNRDSLVPEVKGTHNYVTYADKAAEKMLVEGLGKLIPESGFIAEEGTSTKKGEVFNWVIDPIDGTTNFIHGVPPFAVSVGLMKEKEIVLGVVYEIGMNECFYAWKGGGAFLNGKKISTSNIRKVKDSLFVTGFPYTRFKHMDRFMESLHFFMVNSHGLRRLGSAATDIAYVACGRFEGFYEYGLNPWDIAGGIIILKEAGGKVSDFNGGKNYMYGEEIIAANPYVFDEFLNCIKTIMIK